MEKTGVLLVNLGTPEQPTKQYVKKYLKEFLGDKRVIDLPRWKWLPILNGIILQTRPKKSARLYQSIWTQEGSPLLIHSRNQQIQLQKRFINQANIKISLAMTYGKPSIESELHLLKEWGMTKLIVLPLFPQYSSTTTAPIWDKVNQTISKWRSIPEVTFIRDYPAHPKFIDMLTKKIKQKIQDYGFPDAIVISYHGIPLRYATTGDCYPERCQLTTIALKKKFPSLDFFHSYQSKFGKELWLEPSTEDTISQLARSERKHIYIIAPAFTADCLETLEELEIENYQRFIHEGGETYHYIEAANNDPLFIDCLENLVNNYL